MKWEKIILFVVLVFLGAGFTLAEAISWARGQGDNAIQADLIRTIAFTGRPRSQVLASVNDMVLNMKLVTKTAKEMENMPLPAKNYGEDNVFIYHVIPVYYLAAPLVWILPMNLVMGLIMAISFLGFLALLYLFLRERGVGTIMALVFCLLISAHPAWNQSVFGQVYSDRLFLIVGMFLITTVADKKVKLWRLFLAVFLVLAMIERMLVVSGIFLIMYSFLYRANLGTKQKKIIFGLGLVVLLWAGVIIKFYLRNPFYTNYFSFNSIESLKNFVMSMLVLNEQLKLFLVFNLAPLIILGVWEWRAAAIALVMLLPNIFGGVGGAEKTGWSTHYHSTYFPFWAWAVSGGFINFYRWIGAKRRFLIIMLVVGLTIFTWGVSPYSLGGLKFSRVNVWSNAWMRVYGVVVDFVTGGGIYETTKKMADDLRAAVPEGSSVSMSEYMMVTLIDNRKLYLYPSALDDADYVVVWASDLKAKPPKYRGATSFLGETERERIDGALSIRMERLGYDVYHPVMVGDVAVIKRLRK